MYVCFAQNRRSALTLAARRSALKRHLVSGAAFPHVRVRVRRDAAADAAALRVRRRDAADERVQLRGAEAGGAAAPGVRQLLPQHLQRRQRRAGVNTGTTSGATDAAQNQDQNARLRKILIGRFGKHDISDVCVDVDVAVTLQGVLLLN